MALEIILLILLAIMVIKTSCRQHVKKLIILDSEEIDLKTIMTCLE